MKWQTAYAGDEPGMDRFRLGEFVAEEPYLKAKIELAPEVVELIAANPDKVRLGGASQEVSILFAGHGIESIGFPAFIAQRCLAGARWHLGTQTKLIRLR